MLVKQIGHKEMHTFK